MEGLLMKLNADMLGKMDDVLMSALGEMQKAEKISRNRANDDGYMLCLDLFLEVERTYKLKK